MSTLQNLKVSIIVDYAHEPQSMKRLMKTLVDFRIRLFFDKIIHIISCDGVGRDDWKKPILGMTSYSNADFTLVTTDNYDNDDNPLDIINLLSVEFPKEKEIKEVNEFDGSQKYMKEVNRQKSFELALEIAKKYAEISSDKVKVLIVSTGVGSEQLMVQPEGEIERDEREVWRKVWTKTT
jgi:UDP-N-acetylmuramyl tripeptide synthase